MTGSRPLAHRSRRVPHQPATTTAERDTMIISGSPNPSCGNCSSHDHSQAVSRQSWQSEAASAAFDLGPERRGGAAAGCGAVRQSGPSEPRAEATGGRGQAGSYRHGRVRQSEAWGTFWYADGQATARSIGRRNLRSARDSLAAWCCTAPLQLRGHHPGAMAHHLQYGQTAHQPTAADRQTGCRL